MATECATYQNLRKCQEECEEQRDAIGAFQQNCEPEVYFVLSPAWWRWHLKGWYLMIRAHEVMQVTEDEIVAADCGLMR